MSPRLALLTCTSLLCTTPVWAANTSPSTVTTSVTTVTSPTLVSPSQVATISTIVSGTADVSTALPLLISNTPRTIENTLTLAGRHPEILTSQARVSEASGGVQSARGNRWFTVNGDAEAGGQYFNEPNNHGTEGVADLGLSLNQPLLDGGRRSGAVISAEERFAGANNNLEWQKRLRRYTAAQAHINLWLAQELAANTADNVNQLEQIVTEVHGRLSQGEATVTEIAEAESRLATAHAAQAERMADLGNAQAAYLRDVGEPVVNVTSPGAGISSTESTMEHPLIAAARHAVAEAAGQVRQREAGYWPTLDLRGRASHDAYSGTSRTDPATEGRLTLNLGYTFIDHGVVAGDTAAARAARKAAESELNNTQLEVDAARLNAQSTLTEADRRLQESERAHTESTRVIKNLAQEVKQGNRTLRDLLDARRDDYAAANAWAEAYANRALATYDLERWQ